MGEARPNDKRRHDLLVVGLKQRVRELERQLAASERNAMQFHALMIQARVRSLPPKAPQEERNAQ